MWAAILSDRLAVVALVSRYLTNKLIAHDPLPGRKVPKDPNPLLEEPCDSSRPSGISHSFPWLFQFQGQVSHVLLTLLPLYSLPEGNFRARLACLIHAASVHSEPGSNPSLCCSARARRPAHLGLSWVAQSPQADKVILVFKERRRRVVDVSLIFRPVARCDRAQHVTACRPLVKSSGRNFRRFRRNFGGLRPSPNGLGCRCRAEYRRGTRKQVNPFPRNFQTSSPWTLGAARNAPAWTVTCRRNGPSPPPS
jgi:hypothetical protein